MPSDLSRWIIGSWWAAVRRRRRISAPNGKRLALPSFFFFNVILKSEAIKATRWAKPELLFSSQNTSKLIALPRTNPTQHSICTPGVNAEHPLVQQAHRKLLVVLGSLSGAALQGMQLLVTPACSTGLHPSSICFHSHQSGSKQAPAVSTDLLPARQCAPSIINMS